jgi:putative methyltransferase (TIGR04325 family)
VVEQAPPRGFDSPIWSTDPLTTNRYSDLLRSLRGCARQFVYAAGRLPVIGSVVVQAQRRRFESARGNDVRLYDGIYPDFASALRAIPAGRESGYDNQSSAGRLLDEWLTITPSDYPALFWLSRLLPEAKLLFDWGGNVGLKYFAYRKYLSYDSALIWCVNDVAAVVAVGKEVARREAAPGLCFTTTLDELSEADILFAAGAIHFVEDPLGMLRDSARLPRHVLLNKVPAYDAPSAVTLHNMGTAFCANHLFNTAELVQGFAHLSYRLVDHWISPEMVCEIPFQPEHTVRGYHGFYFMRED